MRNLAIIPARGGSKRIPRKNIRNFLGKPIIAYSIEAALTSRLFSEVMVSTDDEEIAGVAVNFGAVVPFMRNESTSGDYATLSDVVEEVKRHYSEAGRSFDYICCILPTSPLIKTENLEKGLKMLIEHDADSVRPIVRFTYPVQRALRLEDGTIRMFFPENQNARSQDMELSYHDAGQFYWMKFEPGLSGGKKMGFELPETEVQDIDTMEDWKMAEMKYKMMNMPIL